ncbi:hypothetical protein [Actinoplanes subglobosus]|uniref:Uncharacterized protein n=1 Tax=Actinoplanes subglobosus TaxID=1547892 RepID=A0ABV8J4I8_9ACTN
MWRLVAAATTALLTAAGGLTAAPRPATAAPPVTISAVSGPGRLVTVPAVRVADAATIAAGGTLDLSITDHLGPAAGTSTGAVINVSARATAAGTLTAGPGGASPATLHLNANHWTRGSFMVSVDSAGHTVLTNNGTVPVEVSADAVAYVIGTAPPDAMTFHPLTSAPAITRLSVPAGGAATVTPAAAGLPRRRGRGVCPQRLRDRHPGRPGGRAGSRCRGRAAPAGTGRQRRSHRSRDQLGCGRAR